MSELDELYRGVARYRDELQHFGNKNSGRYRRGSGKNPDSTGGGGGKNSGPAMPGYSFSGGMTKIKGLKMWGKTFDLDIIDDVYPGEKRTQGMAQALDNFLGIKRKSITDNGLNHEQSIKETEKYCKRIDENNIIKSGNVFTYIAPKSIVLTQSEKVAVICDTKVDPEHGLATVFNKKGNFENVGPHDIVI